MSIEEYEPAKVWTWKKKTGGKFANINRPIAGPTHDKELAVGKHPLQLYSLATPNGVKVTIMLEELLAAGVAEAEYDAHLINIQEGHQFGSGFIDVNPNSKIPAMMDNSVSPPQRIFESASIVLYLAEKFGHFLSTNVAERTECLSWVFWLQGSAPYLGGGFGHFYNYAPMKIEYAIERFTMETKRQLDVLERRLEGREYLCDGGYSIADMIVWPWYGDLVLNGVYSAAEYLDAASYTNVMAWANRISERPAVQRGRMVNRTWGEPHEQLHERHDARDFETKTQDKIGSSPAPR